MKIPYNIDILLLNNLKLSIFRMSYKVNFFDESPIKTLATTLECKNFSKVLHQSPSDRHAYSLKYFKNPIR